MAPSDRPAFCDPQAVPVVGIDDHLPPVACRRADARRRCASASPLRRPGTPEFRGDAAVRDRPRADRRLGAGAAGAARRRAARAADPAHRPPARPCRARSAFPAAAPSPTMPTPSPPRCARRDEEVGLPRDAVDVHRASCRPTPPSPATSSRRWSRWCSPPFDLAARHLRGGRGLRGAAALPDDTGASPAPRGRAARACGASSCRCPGRASTHRASRASYFIWGATAAMLRNLYRFLRLSGRHARRRRYHRRADELLRRPVRAADRAAASPLPRDNWVHDASDRRGSAGPAATSTPARERHAWVVWCVSVLAPALLAALVHVWLASATTACCWRWPSTWRCCT